MLQRTMAVAGVGAVASSAGCMGFLDGSDDAYADWMPAPAELDAEEPYRFSAYDEDDWTEHEDELETVDFSDFERQWEPLDFDHEDVSTSLYFGPVAVYEASFDDEEAVDELEDEGFEVDGEQDGSDVYVSENGERAFGLGDEILLIANDDWGASGSGSDEALSPKELVELVVDTTAGEADRYVETNDDVGALVDAFGDVSSIEVDAISVDLEEDVESGQFEGMVARGETDTFDGDETERRWLTLYEDEADVDLDDLETWVDADNEFDDVDDVVYEKDDRFGIVAGTLATDELF